MNSLFMVDENKSAKRDFYPLPGYGNINFTGFKIHLRKSDRKIPRD